MYYQPYNENDHKDPATVDRIARVLLGNLCDISEERQARVQQVFDEIKLYSANQNSQEFIDAVNNGFSTVCSSPDATQEDTVLLMRLLVQNRINMTYASFSWYKELVQNYCDVVRKASRLIGN